MGRRANTRLLLLLALAAWTVHGSRLAQAQEPPPAADPAQDPHAPPPSSPPDAEDRLDSAIRSYHAGQHDLALGLLTALVRDEAEAREVVRDARIYMAEILLFQDNQAGARQALELVLREYPDLILDPFQHPPDICAFLELVKADGSWRLALPTPPPPVAQAPRTSPWLPLGIAQARQRRPNAAGLFATGQGLSCGLSAGLFLWLALDNRHGSQDEPGFSDDGQRLWTLDTLQSRRTAQWTTTAICYASYGLGVVDASIAGRRARRATVSAGAGPDPLSVRLTARF